MNRAKKLSRKKALAALVMLSIFLMGLAPVTARATEDLTEMSAAESSAENAEDSRVEIASEDSGLPEESDAESSAEAPEESSVEEPAESASEPEEDAEESPEETPEENPEDAAPEEKEEEEEEESEPRKPGEDLLMIYGAEANTVQIKPESSTVVTETVRVPILMYHSLSETADGSNDMQLTPAVFNTQMAALYQNGYHTVLYSDLYQLVETGKALPNKPIIISFDDGYTDNLTLAAPILSQYGFCAEVSIIGCSVGKSTYKNTGIAITPHFSVSDVLPWVNAGTIHLDSHSYDMHNLVSLDGVGCRSGALPLATESNQEYRYAMLNDFYVNKSILEKAGCDDGSLVFTYPYGSHNELSEQTLKALGVAVTVTTRQGIAQVTYRDRDSLHLLPRLLVTNNTTPQRLLSMIKS